MQPVPWAPRGHAVGPRVAIACEGSLVPRAEELAARGRHVDSGGRHPECSV